MSRLEGNGMNRQSRVSRADSGGLEAEGFSLAE